LATKIYSTEEWIKKESTIDTKLEQGRSSCTVRSVITWINELRKGLQQHVSSWHGVGIHTSIGGNLASIEDKPISHPLREDECSGAVTSDCEREFRRAVIETYRVTCDEYMITVAFQPRGMETREVTLTEQTASNSTTVHNIRSCSPSRLYDRTLHDQGC